jgi:hypothetical protein
MKAKRTVAATNAASGQRILHIGEAKIDVFNVTLSIALAMNKLLCRLSTIYAMADHK